MPLHLRQSLGDIDRDVQHVSSLCGADVDSRVESSPLQQLRPLTSEARLGHRRASIDGLSLEDHKGDLIEMPPIFPAPLSVQGEGTAAKQRRTFLPQLTHAKTFAMRSPAPQEENGDDNDAADHDEHERRVLPPAAPSGEEDTEAFKQAMWAGQANILVTVRVRPHCSHDRDQLEIVRVLDNKLIVVLDKQQQQQQQSSASAPSPQRVSVAATEPLPAASLLQRRHQSHGTHGIRKMRNVASAHPARSAAMGSTNQVQSHGARSREKRYAFDYVFTPQDGQQTVYHHTTKFLIHGVLNGYNATVFAYGCTGAGKTYTMLGTPDEPGIMALTLDDLFQNIERVHADPQATVVYKVTVSFLEVYNENIRDLLVTPPPPGVVVPAATSEFLDLREDPVKGPVVAGISEVEASNAQEVMKLLRRGNKHRSQEATAANAVSSRSHAVLQVLVEQREKHSSADSFGVDAVRGGMMTSTVKYGKLSLVDLAGSERAAVTQNRGQRLIEGANINRSLLALGNCINALGEKGASSVGSGPVFVPYRDSKLTRLLKDSLGGNCRTVMIANVSPASASVEETLNTLKYANRAKNIKTTVTRNVLNVDHHLTAYASVVAELKDEISTLRKQLAVQGGATVVSVEKRFSPGKSKERRQPANTGGREDGHDDDYAWKHAKLKEARGYIAQCFQQRQQLRRNLFEIDHCIEELTRRMTHAFSERGKPCASNSEPEEADEPNTEKNATRKKQRDLATSILEDIVGDPQQHDGDEGRSAGFYLLDECEQLESGIRQLLAHKKLLVSQLERNQSVMDDFRCGIEQSPLFVSNELLRDVLLMEYRVGDLQVENSVLQAKQVTKDNQISSLRGQLSGHDASLASIETKMPCVDLENVPSVDLPTPFTEMARLLSATRSKPEADETPEMHSTRSSTGFAFLDDLRDRFYDRSKGQQSQQQDSRASDNSSSKGSSGGMSPRRQWGIHLNNSTLPYIRLKKKAPPAMVTAGVTSNATAVSAYASGNESSGQVRVSNATTAAPYLKVLKHRRKLHHRSGVATKSSGGSFRKLPVVVSPSS